VTERRDLVEPREITDPWRRVQLGVALLVAVTAIGTLGYAILGLGLLDALYQTVTTISTVGFREVGEPTSAFKWFTVFLVLGGVGTALYTLTVLLETVVEGRLTDRIGRARMQRRIADMSGHVVICGWGRVGRSIAAFVGGAGDEVVVIERDPERIASVDFPYVMGDATEDETLVRAGIDRAATLIAAVNTDADNLFVTLSGRSRQPGLFIVARARVEGSEAKLMQAGADRVVNPQQIGGARMGALATQPHVADFVDVVMHDGSLEFRLAEVPVAPGSELDGPTLREAHIRDRTGALVLAIRDSAGGFNTNPAPETPLSGSTVLIAVGTKPQLDGLRALGG
jgi:voltage-gated potassium channel